MVLRVCFVCRKATRLALGGRPWKQETFHPILGSTTRRACVVKQVQFPTPSQENAAKNKGLAT